MKTKKRIAVIIAAAIAALTLSVSAFAFTGCGEPTIVLNGSTSMEKVITALADAYMESNDVRITYSATGSGAGVTAAQDKTADMGLASRDLTEDEKKTGISATVIAIDAVAIIVHKDNADVTNVTKAQLKDLYINGTDIASVKYGVGREASSGTRECFDDAIGIEGDYKTTGDDKVVIQDGNGPLATYVGKHADSLGYVSLSSVTSDVKAVTYEGVVASAENVKNNTYGLKRNFNLVLPEGGVDALSEAAKGFYEFCLSEEGQKIVEEQGNVSVKA